ncbi:MULTISPECIES: ParB/RepB/Spo0J family partition protein [Massilia]|jgi:ParB family transcriptional regulator, chromosome partitioning protein|uniref:ParB/RepB/Spo0J family partition protein n=1 Tax=Massilia TaxID=149698 RepID=UPI0004E31B04|nr:MULTISPECIES: ParB/RepB/Spo0J family partition protein [Massilia]KFC72582.1 ParB-like partition protein [Massilia sp. LC238]
MTRAGIKVSGLVAAGKVAARDGEDQRKPLVAARPAAAPSVVDLPTRDEPSHDGAPSPSRSADRPAAAREDARKIPVADIVDSPYQPRLKYDPEEIDRLAETMDTAAHADPIKVRMVNGKYELISGHRRIRAARSLGWTEIDAYVEELTDREAQAKTLLLAVGSVGLADYEYALMFATALKEGLCKTQREVASYFGQSTVKVSGCLDMLKLPPKIVRMLDAKPDLFGYQTGAVIKKLCADYPDNLADIERGVQRLTEGAAQNSLKSWVLQAIKGQAERGGAEPNLITNGRRLIFTTKISADQRSVVVNCKVPDLDIAAFEKHLQAWLEVQAKEVSSSAADETGGATQ